ncbi:hypothetical protein GCM10007863_42290 [Dyella mobilis]|nr:hypothetical protein GCM10007863_42290 [Dyella mobilis]
MAPWDHLAALASQGLKIPMLAGTTLVASPESALVRILPAIIHGWRLGPSHGTPRPASSEFGHEAQA